MNLSSNAHTHTTFCDGTNTPAEMVEEAIRLGFMDLGFSSHASAPFDPSCPGLLDEAAYCSEIRRVGSLYNDQIQVACGVETDLYAPVVYPALFDYVIGSVHYLKGPDGSLCSIDAGISSLQNMIQNWFESEPLAMVRNFYDATVENVIQGKPNIVGHFDLVTKLNFSGLFFDENGKEYQTIALEALDNVCSVVNQYGGIVEVNTGAIARGYRTLPYPSLFLLKKLAQNKTRVMINSDSHQTATLNAGFSEALQLVKEAGLKKIAVLRNREFIDITLT